MAPEQPQSSARLICQSHTITAQGENQRPYALLHIGASCAMHYRTGEDSLHIKTIFTPGRVLYLNMGV